MSVTSKHSSHRRNDSGELVVFEAARYFSGAYENPGHHGSSTVFPHNLAGKGGGRAGAGARMSLDIPIGSHSLPNIQKQYLMREKKKYKQPSSPGARLASFLNSLFNQTNSKKKNKSKANSDDVDDHDRPVDRRRSSISHFRIRDNYDSNFTFPASETASSCAKTPTKSSHVDLKSYSGRQKEIYLNRNSSNFGDFPTKWTAEDEGRREFGYVDGGEDSDSSSDLFDLPNLDYYSSGLPVYGTTNMGRIRIEAPISSATTV